MDPVYEMLILFSMYIFLPLGPAVIIYRLFPDTKVTTSGRFQNLTVKATGAFGAYLAIAVGSIFLVNDIVKKIDTQNENDTIWTIQGEICLIDKDSISFDQTKSNYYMKALKDSLDPWPRKKNIPFVSYKVPYKDFFKEEGKIIFELPNLDFMRRTITPKKMIKLKNVVFDEKGKSMNLGKIYIQEVPGLLKFQPPSYNPNKDSTKFTNGLQDPPKGNHI